jgi:hypothetical protein
MGAVEPGEVSETMIKLCLWLSIVLLRKLAIYCNYIWYILRTTDFYILGLQYMEKGKAKCKLVMTAATSFPPTKSSLYVLPGITTPPDSLVGDSSYVVYSYRLLLT